MGMRQRRKALFGIRCGWVSSMDTAWIIALLVDLGFQVNRLFFVLRDQELRCDPSTKIYMFFLVWRFCKRIEHYSGIKSEDMDNTIPLPNLRQTNLRLRVLFLIVLAVVFRSRA